uniref:Uncharacterized protein n=1 Tax=Oryza barthii TaxID=65489 RepID=A0A0D3ELG2_9ORYZ
MAFNTTADIIRSLIYPRLPACLVHRARLIGREWNQAYLDGVGVGGSLCAAQPANGGTLSIDFLVHNDELQAQASDGLNNQRSLPRMDERFHGRDPSLRLNCFLTYLVGVSVLVAIAVLGRSRMTLYPELCVSTLMGLAPATHRRVVDALYKATALGGAAALLAGARSGAAYGDCVEMLDAAAELLARSLFSSLYSSCCLTSSHQVDKDSLEAARGRRSVVGRTAVLGLGGGARVRWPAAVLGAVAAHALGGGVVAPGGGVLLALGIALGESETETDRSIQRRGSLRSDSGPRGKTVHNS